MPIARITSKGQITVPKEVRARLEVEPGDAIEFSFEGEQVTIRPVRRRRLREFKSIFKISGIEDFATERYQAWDAQTRRLGEGGPAADA